MDRGMGDTSTSLLLGEDACSYSMTNVMGAEWVVHNWLIRLKYA
jgi:hypothetical protein